MFLELKKAIETVLSFEPSEDAKLDLLTSIGLDSTNEEIFKVCEEIRNEWPESGEALPPKRNVILRCDDKKQNCDNSWANESDEVHGRES